MLQSVTKCYKVKQLKRKGNFMQAKEFLNKIRYIDMMIDCECEQMQELQNRILSIGSPLGDKVQASLDPDKLTIPISKIIELENEINKDIDTLVDLKREAKQLIEKLDDNVEKLILYKRYFENKTFEQISVELNYSWRHIHRLHSSALQNFAKIYNRS